MMVGAFYGGLVSLVLILPSTQAAPDLAAWLLAWSLQSLGVVVFTATCGLASHIITNARPRAPMKPMRRALYPMPFVGALLLSLDATLAHGRSLVNSDGCSSSSQALRGFTSHGHHDGIC